MTMPPGNPAPGWYPDPAGGGGHRYWDGLKWTDAASPGGPSGPALQQVPQPQSAAVLPPYFVPPNNHFPPKSRGSGWLSGTPKWLVAALAAIAVIALALIARAVYTTDGIGSEGKSASYEWGLRRGDNSVSLVRLGMDGEVACGEMIAAGQMGAGNPVLNPDPPPAPLIYQDAMSGCLDRLRNKLGY